MVQVIWQNYKWGILLTVFSLTLTMLTMEIQKFYWSFHSTYWFVFIYSIHQSDQSDNVKIRWDADIAVPSAVGVKTSSWCCLWPIIWSRPNYTLEVCQCSKQQKSLNIASPFQAYDPACYWNSSWMVIFCFVLPENICEFHYGKLMAWP
jgi:hypothetical protein